MHHRLMRKPRLALMALAAAAVTQPALALDYVWRGGGGNWDDASMWTLLGVPGSGDTATINATGNDSVLVRDLRSVGRLTMNGGALDSSSQLTVGEFRFLGGGLGVVSTVGTGGVTVTGSASFEGTRNLGVASSVTLTLQGNSAWSAGNGSLGGGASRDGQVLNALGARFIDDGAASASGGKTIMGSFGGGSFVNSGTYDRNGLGTTLAYGFNNTGTLNINGGSFRLSGSGQSSGTVNVAAGARLFLDAANDIGPAAGSIGGTVNNLGLVELGRGNYTFTTDLVIGGALSLLNDGTLANQSTNTLSSLTIATSSASGLTGSGRFTTSSLNFVSGVLGGTSDAAAAGSTVVTGTATFDGTRFQTIGANHTLTLLGTSTWSAGSGSIGGQAGAVVVNAAGVSFSDAGGANATDTRALMGSTGSRFVNSGTYNRNGLGTTLAYGFNNTGTLNINGGSFRLSSSGQSSGTVNVAVGARLFLDAANEFAPGLGTIAGTVNNLGLVELGRGNYTFMPGLVIGGAVSLTNDGVLTNLSTNTLSSLTIATSSASGLTGGGRFTTGTFNFVSGVLGGFSDAAAAGSTVVTGTATFDGTRFQTIGANHTLTLLGASNWSAGSGSIGGAATGSLVVNAAGATFTDAGATSGTGTKTLMSSTGGSFVNDGSFVRSGPGTTRADGFSNRGTLDIVSGTFAAASRFSNTGSVRLAAGAVLAGQFSNAGLITGTGTVRTGSNTQALVNAGTLDPGSSAGVGTLTVEGDLTQAAGSVLHIDLGSAGASDRLDVTDDALWGGTLAVWAPQGQAFQLGDSFVIATYGQRLSSSTFSAFSWLGSGANPFSVEYNAHDITLRVSAVPEPGSWLLMLAGVVLVGGAARLRLRQRAAA